MTQESSAPLIDHVPDASETNSSIEQVALTVPITDDPSLPAVTLRTWFLGVVACMVLSFLKQFFYYRKEPLALSSVSAQIAVVPLGHLMASAITRRVFLEGTRWEFSLNPGPFNVKEHVLITIFANCGAGSVYAIHIVSTVKLFYRREMSFFVAFMVVLTNQVLGYGFAGIFRRYLVDPAAMWWPQNLVQVSLFRALHEKDKRANGGMSRNQFFVIALICSFAYYVLPGYLFLRLTSLSWLCWVFPASVFAHQLGSGLHGLGLGSFGLDWSSISSYLGSPLASPWFVTVNVAAGFVLVLYVIVPLAYWFDIYDAKQFPIFSDELFTTSGQKYNVSAITDANFRLDVDAYEREGPLRISTLFALSFGVNFACLAATVVHVVLFHGRQIMELSGSAIQNKKMDVHTRLMSKYKQVPEWWFICILLVTIIASMFTCQYFNEVLQLPWWGVLLASSLAFLFILPVGVIQATTNQSIGLNIITEYVFGYIYPGYPIANVCFKVYGFISMTQAIAFLEDFKLGHYMKIPPQSMFMAQVVGAIVSAVSHIGTSWWLMDTIPNICDRASLPPESLWTCPGDHVFYDASVIWGLIGPRRIFGDLGYYSAINWFFLVGAAMPLLVWLATKSLPEKRWIALINVPVIFGAMKSMPPATSVNYVSWILIGFVFGHVVYKYHRTWWGRYNYVLSGALDTGLAFMGVCLYLCLDMENVRLQWWGNDSEGCPLASCPTQHGVIVQGCPVL